MTHMPYAAAGLLCTVLGVVLTSHQLLHTLQGPMSKWSNRHMLPTSNEGRQSMLESLVPHDGLLHVQFTATAAWLNHKQPCPNPTPEQAAAPEQTRKQTASAAQHTSGNCSGAAIRRSVWRALCGQHQRFSS
jgi:hypothetical protein